MMDQRSPRRPIGFTLVEILIVVGIISVLMALLLPALQTVRRTSRSTQCQNNLRNICLVFKKTQANLKGSVRADNLQQSLAEYMEDAESVWYCPANPDPSTNSYGFNDRMHRFNVRDGGKIVGLDYQLAVADVAGMPPSDDWSASVRTPHFDKTNVVFYDAHVENKSATDIEPDNIDPDSCENQVRYWMPTRNLSELPTACDEWVSVFLAGG